MYESRVEILGEGEIQKYAVLSNGTGLDYRTVLNLWLEDEAFRDFYISLLAVAPYTAFRWETPPITSKTMQQPFEFVLINASWLECTPDPLPFWAYFESDDSDQGIVDFVNLGGDAVLVAPCPIIRHGAYGHLAAFVRRAPRAQKHALWRVVAETLIRRISRRVVWLSTAGGGVWWLHVRLDDRPKYYAYKPYRTH